MGLKPTFHRLQGTCWPEFFTQRGKVLSQGPASALKRGFYYFVPSALCQPRVHFILHPDGVREEERETPPPPTAVSLCMPGFAGQFKGLLHVV